MASLQRQFSKQPLKKINWMRYISFLCSIIALDLAVHFQYIPSQTEKETNENTKNVTSSEIFNYSKTAKILFFCSIVRSILLGLSFKIFYDKSIPKLVQPYAHYVTMTTVFVFISLSIWRLLIDSEPPNNIFNFTYMTLITLDVIFVFCEYSLNRYVLKRSGAIVKDENEKKSKKKKKKKKTERQTPVLELLKKLTFWYTSEWLSMVVGYGLMTVAIIGNASEPYLNSQLIDAINSDKPSDTLPSAIVWFSLCVLLQSVADSSRRHVTDKVGRRIAFKAKCQMYSNILRQEVGFFDETTSGTILNRLGSSASNHELEELWSHAEMSVQLAFQLGTQLIVMFGMSWRLTLIILVGNYIVWLPENIISERWNKQFNDEYEIESTLTSMASEAVRNIRTVKSFANEDDEAKKFKTKLEEYNTVMNKGPFVEAALTNFEKVVWLVMRGIVLLYGGHLIGIKQLTAGTLISFLLYMEQLWSSTSYMISTQSRSLVKMLLKMEKFFDYFERESKVDTKGKERAKKLRGQLEFKNVSFCYPTRPESAVLQDLSFTVGEGEVVALVGASGGGKSTCVNLIERFYDPLSGSITLDDKPLSSYDNKYLHQQISLVSQEPVLFGGSIEENIKYGKPEATHEEVVKAARDANAHDFITALDDGYETDVGEAGQQMSGGQKQRIAIARALITNPKIMLLDEATSALDAESESLVQEALQNSMQGRTVIIIAHRLSTVEHADKIVVINKGVVAEQGSHNELLETDGVYCKLVRKQITRKSKPTRTDDLVNADNEIDAEKSEMPTSDIKAILRVNSYQKEDNFDDDSESEDSLYDDSDDSEG